MKRCPECRRDYYDDTLLFCLDDGNALLEGPERVIGSLGLEYSPVSGLNPGLRLSLTPDGNSIPNSLFEEDIKPLADGRPRHRPTAVASRWI
jgi:hypothetical protein